MNGYILDRKLFEQLTPSWERIKNCGKPVLIYGMGNGSEKILRLFDRFGITCDGVFASDDFVRGQSFCGYKVQRFSDIMSDPTDKLIVLGFGSSLDEIMQRIESIEQRFELIAPDTSVTDDGYFDKQRFFDLFSKASRAYSLLEDDLSRKTFECVTAFKITGIRSTCEIASVTSKRLHSFSVLTDRRDAISTSVHTGEIPLRAL